MRVVCRLCQYEDAGFCTKKGQQTKPVKIALNKKRSCELYKEDARRVLFEYRKREEHENKVKQLRNAERRRMALGAAIKTAELPINESVSNLETETPSSGKVL